jgi:tetratricopeptide (TPR) repeat protein
MMGPHYQRASLLCDRERYAEAITELQQAIAEDENDPFAQGLLAVCLSETDRHQQAIEAAKRAIEIAPDSDYGHAILARVYADRGRLNEAFAAVSAALQIDPEDAVNQGWLARIEFERGNWEASAAAAEAGLALDAENDFCLHYRSFALTKLGRGDEARRDQETLLAANPDDPHSHAARGWTLLEKGDAEKAKEHFLEALRIDPRLDYARAGLANALKARHFVFGLALRSLLFFDRFKAWTMWIIWGAVFLGLGRLDRLAASFPGLMVPLVFVKAAVWGLALALLIAHPLFDLILRLDRDGRRALSADQVKASNWHAASLLAGLGMALLWAMRGDLQMRTLALTTLMLTMPIAHTFDATPGWVRIRMAWLTILAALLIPLSFVMFVAALYLRVKFKWHTTWLIMPALLYLPLASMLLSNFADNIAAWLEQRRPDAGTEDDLAS